ncbi:MAG: YafY family transcriptional regulator [Vallitalea sp.]|jgi:predicted DNA-binding transcriptional regulator YafY|nr:YafY family transcriptional regulator [Vallitalea sp.]
MRIDRLLSITTYLLNRNIVTGKELAEKFEVSERTIQRDIEAINMAGIPIVSLKGAHGGYQIMDTFKLLKQANNKEDMEIILMALKGLETTLDDNHISTTIEKIKSVSNSDKYNETISVDFSVIHENTSISKYIQILSKAIVNRKVVSITYSSADNFISKREIEPVLLKYKWYTWYLVAYCKNKQDYRIFKLARIGELSVTNQDCMIQHVAEEKLFDTLMGNDNRKYIHIKLLCNKKAMYIIKEYIPNCKIHELNDKEFSCEIDVPENERMWYAILLSLGDDVKIIKPDSLKKRLYYQAKKIINFYKDDI